jgi:hypothetical protein
MSRRILAVGSGPLACLSLSRLAIDAAPKSAETGLCGLPSNSQHQRVQGRKKIVCLGVVTFLKSLLDVMSTSSSKNNNIQKRISTKPIRPMNRHTSRFTSGIKPLHNTLFARFVDSNYFAGVAGRNAAHVVMDGRENGDGFFGDVDACKDRSGFGDTWQAFFEDFGGEVRKLEVDMIMLRTDASSFPEHLLILNNNYHETD